MGAESKGERMVSPLNIIVNTIRIIHWILPPSHPLTLIGWAVQNIYYYYFPVEEVIEKERDKGERLLAVDGQIN